MTSVVDIFRTLIPSRAKSSPSGWTSFNAPCCQHRGHSPDKRRRAGIRLDLGIIYNCFNCKFTTGWKPGFPIGEKMKNLCRWLGANDDIINSMIFESLKNKPLDYVDSVYKIDSIFAKKTLPEGALAISEWAAADLPEDVESKILDVCQYLIDRDQDPLNDSFCWSPISGFSDRVIIPFRFNKEIVGYTARKINNGKPKYLSDQSPHYVFNIDRQHFDQRYILVTEGPFDALAVNGVALLTNSISEQQKRIIDEVGAEVIVIPDQDQAGLNVFDQAAEYDWSVSTPTWSDDVKDCSDAVKKYGKLFVVVDAILTAQRGKIKINLAKKRLEKKLEKISRIND